MLDLLIYLIAGVGAGATAGLFGIGGGVVVVPVLLPVFALQGVHPDVAMHLAVGTSLATIIATTFSSARSHYQQGGVDPDVLRWLAVGAVAGAALGAVVASWLPGDVLQRVFGTFMIAVAAYMGFGRLPEPRASHPRPAGLMGAGTGIGALSVMVGVGGGTMTVPYLTWRGLTMHRAVGTSAAVALPLAACGTGMFIVTGWGNPHLPAWATGYVYWPAFLGIVAASMVVAPRAARLAHRLPGLWLRRGFGVILVIIGVRLLTG